MWREYISPSEEEQARRRERAVWMRDILGYNWRCIARELNTTYGNARSIYNNAIRIRRNKSMPPQIAANLADDDDLEMDDVFDIDEYLRIEAE